MDKMVPSYELSPSLLLNQRYQGWVKAWGHRSLTTRFPDGPHRARRTEQSAPWTVIPEPEEESQGALWWSRGEELPELWDASELTTTASKS